MPASSTVGGKRCRIARSAAQFGVPLLFCGGEDGVHVHVRDAPHGGAPEPEVTVPMADRPTAVVSRDGRVMTAHTP